MSASKACIFALLLAGPMFLVAGNCTMAAEPGNPATKPSHSPSRAQRLEAISLLRGEVEKQFDIDALGFDIIIGPSGGSPLGLLANAVNYQPPGVGLVPHSVYAMMTDPANKQYQLMRQYVHSPVIPIVIGDSYAGHSVVATSTEMFGLQENGNASPSPFEYRVGHHYKLAQGRVFHPSRFEAVIGSEIAASEKLEPSSRFRVTHGMPGPAEAPHVHKPQWTVVGVLAPTGTAADRTVFIPLPTFFAVAEHEEGILFQMLMREGIEPRRATPDDLRTALAAHGMAPDKLRPGLKRFFHLERNTGAEDDDAYHIDADGNVIPELPKSEWPVSAILVKSRGLMVSTQLQYYFRVVEPRAIAVDPTLAVRDYFAPLEEVVKQAK